MQVERCKDLLREDDVFILDSGSAIVQWNGRSCSKDEKFKVQFSPFINKQQAEKNNNSTKARHVNLLLSCMAVSLLFLYVFGQASCADPALQSNLLKMSSILITKISKDVPKFRKLLLYIISL